MLFNKFSTFLHFSLRRKSLLVATFFLSIYSWFLLLFLIKYARFGVETEETKSVFFTDESLIYDICLVIFLIGKYVPWQNVCRHQAFQAKILCNHYKIPYKIYVGFRKGTNGDIDGHAWTMVNDLIVTGFCNPEEYVVQQIYS